jgi:hypothetical protein
MPLRLSFNLGDGDLRHFEQVAQQTQALARTQPADLIVSSAREVLERGAQAQGADFVKERYSRLRAMLAMIEDAEWRLESDDKQRTLNALACFSVSNQNGSPASVLDHAIMIELVSRDLHHDLAAHRDFTRFREARDRKQRKLDPDARTKALELRREVLMRRMHERRKRDLERAGSSVRKLFGLFGM